MRVTTRGQSDRVESYEKFFGLNEAPFSLAPDPRFLFASASHSAALAQVAYGLERREPLVVITGDIGTGKTLLCRTMLQRLRRKTFLSVINDPLLERDDLLKQLLQDFGVISKDRTRLTEATRHELVQTLHTFLRSLAPLQAHAVVMIDEAQHLRPDVLEEIRLLSNIDDERGTLLQIILVGQTDLEPVLSRPELRQLQQRVSRRFQLQPLNTDEVQQYIEHRLAQARDGMSRSQAPGATELARELAAWAGTNAAVDFTPEAIEAVSELSGGLPRVINLLCDRALEEAYASRLRVVDRPLMQTAARALGIGPQTVAASTPSFWPLARSESTTVPDNAVHTDDEAVPVGFRARTRAAATPLRTKYVLLATSLAAAAVSIWFGVRAARQAGSQAPPSASPPAVSAPRAASAAPNPPATGTSAPLPEAAAPTATPTPPTAIAPAPAAVAETATSGGFDIVVASFRTDERATLAATEVAAIGLPIRRRVLDGWHQVLAGPFASRADAEQAQQRLDHAGLTGTQIVPTAR